MKNLTVLISLITIVAISACNDEDDSNSLNQNGSQQTSSNDQAEPSLIIAKVGQLISADEIDRVHLKAGDVIAKCVHVNCTKQCTYVSHFSYEQSCEEICEPCVGEDCEPDTLRFFENIEVDVLKFKVTPDAVTYECSVERRISI